MLILCVCMCVFSFISSKHALVFFVSSHKICVLGIWTDLLTHFQWIEVAFNNVNSKLKKKKQYNFHLALLVWGSELTFKSLATLKFYSWVQLLRLSKSDRYLFCLTSSSINQPSGIWARKTSDVPPPSRCPSRHQGKQTRLSYHILSELLTYIIRKQNEWLLFTCKFGVICYKTATAIHIDQLFN